MKIATAIELKCSAFEQKIVSPSEKQIIRPASNNRKLSGGGKISVIQRGKWQGFPLFKISLEERKTCPETCKMFDKCYGNHMQFAYRTDHTNPDFLEILQAEITILARMHKYGFVIRLHELGDFYSVKYVSFWKRMIEKFPNLNIYGYTAREKDSDIGKQICILNQNTKRVFIRFSGVLGENGAVVNHIGKEAFICPSKRLSCMECCLCWNTRKCVSFIEH